MAKKTVSAIRWTVANDLTGRVFGRLSVMGPTERRLNACIVWRCRCNCGKEAFVKSTSLVSGHTTSCGCWQRGRLVTHGAARTKKRTNEYNVWASMLARCHTPTHRAFNRYGGRGIVVCERWHVFENFLTDMGPCPSGLTLERIDNNHGYEPKNCKWATRREQNRNTSSTRWLTFNGITLCLTDWALRAGIDRGRLGARLRHGWSVERALTTPPEPQVRDITFNGTTRRLNEWATITGLSTDTIAARIKLGWTVERALTAPRYPSSKGRRHR